MPTSKLKNIFILILVAANLALGALSLYRQGLNFLKQQDALTQTIAVLQEGGISLTQEIPRELTLMTIYVTREESSERSFMERFLGSVEVQDWGGPVRYRSEQGEGFLRQNGEFEILLTDMSIPWTDSTAAQALLKKESINTVLAQELQEDGAHVLTFTQLLEQAPVRGYEITMTYQDDALTSVRGRLIPTARQAVSLSGETLDTATLLLRFYAAVRESGYVCSAITRISPCYHLSALGNSFEPLWRFETDTGDYYVNPSTGLLV